MQSVYAAFTLATMFARRQDWVLTPTQLDYLERMYPTNYNPLTGKME